MTRKSHQSLAFFQHKMLFIVYHKKIRQSHGPAKAVFIVTLNHNYHPIDGPTSQGKTDRSAAKLSIDNLVPPVRWKWRWRRLALISRYGAVRKSHAVARMQNRMSCFWIIYHVCGAVGCRSRWGYVILLDLKIRIITCVASSVSRESRCGILWSENQ